MDKPTPPILVASIVNSLRNRFPGREDSIFEWVGPLVRTPDEDRQLSYKAPAIAVALLPSTEAEDELVPWNIRLNIGFVVVHNAPSREERHRQGWAFTWEVVQFAYRQCWGYSKMDITPFKFTAINKNTPMGENNVPLDVDYWTLQGYHNIQL